MAWTKRQLVEMAFDNIGLGGAVYDLSPADLELASKKMDVMMASWEARGIRVGYPMSSEIQDLLGVPDRAIEAIASNLAVRLAPAYGKLIAAELKFMASDSYDALLGVATAPPEQQLPNMLPSGAGNKGFWGAKRTVDGPEYNIEAGGDGELDFK